MGIIRVSVDLLALNYRIPSHYCLIPRPESCRDLGRFAYILQVSDFSE